MVVEGSPSAMIPFRMSTPPFVENNTVRRGDVP